MNKTRSSINIVVGCVGQPALWPDPNQLKLLTGSSVSTDPRPGSNSEQSIGAAEAQRNIELHRPGPGTSTGSYSVPHTSCTASVRSEAEQAGWRQYCAYRCCTLSVLVPIFPSQTETETRQCTHKRTSSCPTQNVQISAKNITVDTAIIRCDVHDVIYHNHNKNVASIAYTTSRILPLMLWHCWLSSRKDIQPLKPECRYLGGGDLTGALHLLLEFRFAPSPSPSLLMHNNPVWFPTPLPPRLFWHTDH